MQRGKNMSFFLNKKPVFFFKKTSSKKKSFFMFFYYFQFKGRKVFFNTLECLSCYIQVVKHYIQYVNYIFIDSETNY